MRVLLIVAYDGTEYSGWQVQDNAETIEGVLTEAIKDLTGETPDIAGASRTDAGVHSYGNLCVFDTESKIPAEKFRDALNVRLPEDIRVMESREVGEDFHPRFTPTVKTYEYRIWNDSTMLPTMRLYTDHIYGGLDIEAMDKAAAMLVGEHDFAAFCSAGAQVKSTVRTLTEARVFRDAQDSRLVIIRVSGEGFLYNMVRIIAGTLIEIGMGRRQADEMRDIIMSCDRSKAGPTAPAKGLTHVKTVIK